MTCEPDSLLMFEVGNPVHPKLFFLLILSQRKKCNILFPVPFPGTNLILEIKVILCLDEIVFEISIQNQKCGLDKWCALNDKSLTMLESMSIEDD